MKERLPRESETIAVKRSVRLAKKLAEAKERLIERKAWWSNRALETLGIIAIAGLNLYLVYPFFGTASSHIAFSGPVIPILAKTIALMGMPFTYAVQIVNIIFFVSAPLSYYFLIKMISGRKLAAFIALLIYNLPIYPFAQARVVGALIGPDGPHIASLVLIPLAIAGLLSFLKFGEIKNLLLASASAVLIALTSPFGILTYIIFAILSTFSEMLLGSGRLKLARFAAIILLIGGLSSFWYNPQFFLWMISGPMGSEVRMTISKLIPISFFITPILAIFGFLIFDRKPDLQPVFLSIFYTISFGMILLVGGGLFPSHPSRYISEFGMSLSFLLGILINKGIDYLKTLKFLGLSNIEKDFFSVGVVIVIVSILSFWTVAGREGLMVEEKVLGLWTEVERGEIWVAKDQFGGLHSFLGFAITGLTLSILTFLGVKSTSQE